MADQNINIKFTGDASQLNKTIDVIEQNVLDLQGKLRNTGSSQSFSLLKQNFQEIGSGIAKAGAVASSVFGQLASNILPKVASVLLGGGIVGGIAALVSGLFTADDAVKKVSKTTSDADTTQKEFAKAVDHAAASVLNQSDKLSDLKGILISTTSEVGNLTQATINQGVAQFIFDKKNVEVQKILNAEIQKGIKARTFSAGINATVPEFNSQLFSENPLDKIIGQGKSQIGQLDAISTGFEKLFKTFLEGTPKVKKAIKENITDPIQGIKLGSIQIELNPVLSLKPDSISKIKEGIKKLEAEIQKPSDLNVSSKPSSAFTQVLTKNKAITEGLADGLKETEESARRAASVITDTLMPAFDGFVSAVFAGKDPIKGFFQGVIQSIEEVIKKLIAAAIEAAIFTAILNISTGGGAGLLAGFGGVFKGLLGFQRSPTSFGSVSGGFRAANLVATVRGTDLAFVLQQGQNSIGRVG